jgi:spermidine synthase
MTRLPANAVAAAPDAEQNPAHESQAAWHYGLALLLTALSGAAALGQQMVWVRALVDVLGASAETFSKVIGAFFLGLAVGSWVAGRLVAPSLTAWRAVAWAEFGVAALAMPVLLAGQWGGVIHAGAVPSWLIKLIAPVLLIAPPAAAMGLVLPWLVHALAQSRAITPQRLVWLYGTNTAGGVLGIAAVVLAALPLLGLTATALAMAGINLFTGIAAWSLQAHARPSTENGGVAWRWNRHLEGTAVRTRRQEMVFYGTAFASGFLVLGMEVMYQLQILQVTINSLYSGSAVLGLVLAALALGAWILPWLHRWVGGGERATLAIALAAAGILTALQPAFFAKAHRSLNILPYELPALSYAWELLKLGGMVLLPSLVAAGLVFPALLQAAGHESPDRAGLITGRLLMWNGLGGWLGAELTRGWIAPHFGLWLSLAVLSMGYFGLFLIAATERPAWLWRGGAAAALLAVFIGANAAGRLPHLGQEKEKARLLALGIEREGVVAAVEIKPGDRRIVLNNSYTLGGTTAQMNQERQAHLPILLHGQAKSIGMIGVATGGTVAGAALHPEVERVDAIELCPVVLRFAREHFADSNRGIFSDSRFHFHLDDARWVLGQNPNAYDVVVGDLFLPWRTGEGRLFTREHFETVRRSLKPGGIFCQWLPMFQLTERQFQSILATFQEVFPDTVLVRGDFYSELPIIGLVGNLGPGAIDWERTAEACARLRDDGRSKDPLARHPEGVAMMLIGGAPRAGSAPINTLGNSWLEFDASRNIVGMAQPWFVGVPLATMVREAQRGAKSLVPEKLRDAHEAGQFFLTLEIAAAAKSPDLDLLKSKIPEHLPVPLQTDAQADWKPWPSRIKPKDAP